MMAMMEEITAKIAQEGNAVVVGRGAPFFLREQPDAFHVFLYAPRAEKIRRLLQDGSSEAEAEDMVDRERIAFVKHYFDATWPTRSLYHVMLNTAVGNNAVIETILQHHALGRRPTQSHRLRTLAQSPQFRLSQLAREGHDFSRAIGPSRITRL